MHSIYNVIDNMARSQMTSGEHKLISPPTVNDPAMPVCHSASATPCKHDTSFGTAVTLPLWCRPVDHYIHYFAALQLVVHPTPTTILRNPIPTRFHITSSSVFRFLAIITAEQLVVQANLDFEDNTIDFIVFNFKHGPKKSYKARKARVVAADVERKKDKNARRAMFSFMQPKPITTRKISLAQTPCCSTSHVSLRPRVTKTKMTTM